MLPALADTLGIDMSDLYADGEDDDESAAVADLMAAIQRIVRVEVALARAEVAAAA